MAGKLFVGTSGYSYPHWSNGLFYPSGLSQKKWLEFYATKFDTVELNISFYRLPSRAVFEGWRCHTPDNFLFAAKGSRYITHIKRLKDSGEPIKKFFDQASGLGNKLGAVLWQLPPRMSQNLDRLDSFCANLSQNRDSLKIRQAFEFRHPSWFNFETIKILKAYNFCLCIAHSKYWPLSLDMTADFAYLRFHGGEELYGSNYSDNELRYWALYVKKWRGEGKDVFAYFNNDAYGYALTNALKLKKLTQKSTV